MPQFGKWDTDLVETDPIRKYPKPIPDAVPVTTPAPTAPDYGTFEFPDYTGAASPSYNFPTVPNFNAPDFYAPTFEQAQQEPGYQFRLDAGRQALERSAAARGVLRTGGTLKDINEYGQKYGAEEYSNVFNRAMQSYGAKYQAAKDEYAPYLAQYQNQFGAEQARAMAEFNRQYELYQSQLDAEKYKEGLIYGSLQIPAPTFPSGSY